MWKRTSVQLIFTFLSCLVTLLVLLNTVILSVPVQQFNPDAVWSKCAGLGSVTLKTWGVKVIGEKNHVSVWVISVIASHWLAHLASHGENDGLVTDLSPVTCSVATITHLCISPALSWPQMWMNDKYSKVWPSGDWLSLLTAQPVVFGMIGTESFFFSSGNGPMLVVAVVILTFFSNVLCF